MLLIFDLGSFGWFYEWKYHSPSQSFLTPTASAQKYARILNQSQQRILPIRGGTGSGDEIPVNISRLWGVPSASGYGPLILSRINQLLSMGTPGDVAPKWDSEDDRSLDIMSVRYIFTPDNSSATYNSRRLRYLENINQANVYENLRAQPRVWLVPEVINLKPDEILSAIKSSKLPDGRTYEPSKIALVEENIDFNTENFDSEATTHLIELDDTHLQIQTNSNSPTFLVLSDVNYPGWQAKIDGKPTHIFQTNYVLRGIILPEGNHTVQFEFKSKSFHIGLGITTAALLLLAYVSFRSLERQKLVI